MGRLWQSLILGKLHPLFEHLPVEDMVYSNQQQYYDAITASTNAGQSGPFIDFMLSEIYKTLKSHQGEPLQDKVADKVANKVANKSAQKVIMLLSENGHLTRDELSERTGLSLGGIKKIINSLRENGLIVRVGSNKTGYWKVTIDNL